MHRQAAFLSTALADRKTRQIALAVMLTSVGIFVTTAPFARVQLPALPAFIPFYQSALAINDLITAVLLFAQFYVLRSHALLVIACGYLFTAVMAVTHALTFPGLFSPSGLLGAGPQTTAWLYMFWHGVFPLTVVAYVFLQSSDRGFSARRMITAGILAVAIAAAALTVLATAGQRLLPPIMVGNSYTPAMIVVVTSVWLLSLAALIALWLRPPYRVLDLWLMVVMCIWLCDIALSAVLNGGRFDLGFYAGRIYGLVASTIVLLMLLLELSALYARLFQVAQVEHEQRKHAIGALRNSLARQHALFSSAFIGILTVDRSGAIETLNPAAMRMFGCGSDETSGRDIGRLIDLQQMPGANSADCMQQLVQFGGEIREFEAYAADGSKFPVDIMVAEMPADQKSTFVVFARDISEKKRIERMKDEFVATVSHELRTPVTSMVAALGLIAGRAAEVPAPVRHLLLIAQNNGRRLAQLLSDILDIDNIESNRLSLRFEAIHLKSVIEASVEASRALAADFNIMVKAGRMDDAVVRVDRERLEQALLNLLSNAVKFSPPGSEVEVSVEAGAESARIVVRDQGLGIPEDFKERIFEKFVQVDATDTRQKGGTGLGLSIVRQIVSRLGGEVGHYPAAGRGTCFYLDLPVSVQQGEEISDRPGRSSLVA